MFVYVRIEPKNRFGSVRGSSLDRVSITADRSFRRDAQFMVWIMWSRSGKNPSLLSKTNTHIPAALFDHHPPTTHPHPTVDISSNIIRFSGAIKRYLTCILMQFAFLHGYSCRHRLVCAIKQFELLIPFDCRLRSRECVCVCVYHKWTCAWIEGRAHNL